MATISESDIFAPSFWGAWNDFLLQKYTDMWFTGGRGCISGDTLIATPTGDVPAKDFKGGTVYAYDGKSLITAHACPAEKFSIQDLYTVTLSDGSSIEVTDEHRFLTPSSGWKMTKQLRAGDSIAVANPSYPRPTSEPSLSIPPKFRFPIIAKTLFERSDDSIATVDSCSNWTSDFTVPSDSTALTALSIVSISKSRSDFYYDIFVPVYNNYLSSNGILNHNSTKSSFVTMCIVLGMIRDSQEAFQQKRLGNKRWMSYLTHAIVYRKIAADLRISVYNQFIWSIEKLGLTDEFKFSISPLRITYKRTGQMIDFRGLDDPIKSKSIKAPFGYYKYNFFEELNQFDGIEEVRNVRQSIMRGGPEGWQEAEKAIKAGMTATGNNKIDNLIKKSRFQSFCAFNPPPQVTNWAVYESRKIVPGRKVYHSDYRSVPREWLGETFFQQAEILRLDNELAYRNEYLGESTGGGGNVFSNVSDLRMSDELIKSWASVSWGMDFGTVDPTVLLGVYYNSFERSVYIFDEVYKSNMMIDDMVEAIRQHHFGYSWIVGDTAAKPLIRELENHGLPMSYARKGPGSIEFGIKFLQNCKHIYIDQVRCPKAFEEFTLYEYKKLKDGSYTSLFCGTGDHTIDACLAGDTIVSVDGKQARIEDLVGKTGFVYGFDIEKGKIIKTGFKNVRLTRKSAKIIVLKFGSNSFLRCTDDHKILSGDGTTYIEAGRLSPGDNVWDGEKATPLISREYEPCGVDVFDMEVPETQNFLANGIVVHNCRYALEDISSDSTGMF